MPHSPRLWNGRLWVLNSGTGELGHVEFDGSKGSFKPLAFCPGFVRGLAFHGKYAFVGLSKPRYQRFEGLALDQRLADDRFRTLVWRAGDRPRRPAPACSGSASMARWPNSMTSPSCPAAGSPWRWALPATTSSPSSPMIRWRPAHEIARLGHLTDRRCWPRASPLYWQRRQLRAQSETAAEHQGNGDTLDRVVPAGHRRCHRRLPARQAVAHRQSSNARVAGQRARRRRQAVDAHHRTTSACHCRTGSPCRSTARTSATSPSPPRYRPASLSLFLLDDDVLAEGKQGPGVQGCG